MDIILYICIESEWILLHLSLSLQRNKRNQRTNSNLLLTSLPVRRGNDNFNITPPHRWIIFYLHISVNDICESVMQT